MRPTSIPDPLHHPTSIAARGAEAAAHPPAVNDEPAQVYIPDCVRSDPGCHRSNTA